jgi:NADH-quinone oxidoreductase subunit J
VLFLFVVMMLDVNFDNLRKSFRSYIPVGATVGMLVLLEMTLVLIGGGTANAPSAGLSQPSNTKALGALIYVDYVYPFEIAAVVLLVAIVAAIALTWRRRKETRYQNPSAQVKVRPRDRLRIVSMASEKRED